MAVGLEPLSEQKSRFHNIYILHQNLWLWLH